MTRWMLVLLAWVVGVEAQAQGGPLRVCGNDVWREFDMDFAKVAGAKMVMKTEIKKILDSNPDDRQAFAKLGSLIEKDWPKRIEKLRGAVKDRTLTPSDVESMTLELKRHANTLFLTKHAKQVPNWGRWARPGDPPIGSNRDPE